MLGSLRIDALICVVGCGCNIGVSGASVFEGEELGKNGDVRPFPE